MVEWLAVDETAKSLLTRTLSRRIPPFTSLPPLHRFPLHAGHVVEIVGPSNSGKSEVLLQAAIACVLPKQLDGISYGGSEGIVMMFDLDCRFDMLRFIEALQLRINETRAGHLGSSKNTAKEGEHVFTSCLKRFFYIRCQSSFHFLTVLKTLHAKIKRLSEAGLCPPHLLMIDSINAFYWIDRSVSTATSSGPGVGRTALSVQVVSEAVVQELSHILESHPLLILSTKSLIQSLTSTERKNADGSEDRNFVDKEQVPRKEGKGRAVLRDFMPAVWQGFVTHRLLLQGPLQPGSDNVPEDCSFYTAEWQIPYLNQVDKFIIQEALSSSYSIFMVRFLISMKNAINRGYTFSPPEEKQGVSQDQLFKV